MSHKVDPTNDLDQSYLDALARQHPVLLSVARTDYSTKKELRARLQAYPRSERGALADAVEQVIQARRMINDLRRAKRRVQWKNPTPDLAERLFRYKATKFWNAYQQADIREAKHVDQRSVQFGRGPAVTVHSTFDWDGYSRATRYPMQRYSYTFAVPSDWGVRVAAAGLAVLDGLLTMDAVLLDSRVRGDVIGEPIRAYSAAWIAQGRGVDLRLEHGFLAVSGRFSYHSVQSADHAVRGLVRKIRAAGRDKARRSPTRRIDIVLGRDSIENLVEWAVAAAPDLVVTFADAEAIGACIPGILSWCNQVGIDPVLGYGSAPIRQVLAAYQKVPATEARAAILHAIRANVAARRAVVAASQQVAAG
jgi:hypothetical protein